MLRVVSKTFRVDLDDILNVFNLNQKLRGALSELLSALLNVADRVALIGGVTRDFLLWSYQEGQGRRRRPKLEDVDLVVQAPRERLPLLLEVMSQVGGKRDFEVNPFEGFGTFELRFRGEHVGFNVDVAVSRRESYAHPGALPDVELGVELEVDLLRRDFRVNAIAMEVFRGEDSVRVGRLIYPSGALMDLKEKVLVPLHELSFVDDPTRAIRGVRYAAKLGFELRLPDDGGEWLRSLRGISRERFTEELRLALSTALLDKVVSKLISLGVFEAVEIKGEPPSRRLLRGAGGILRRVNRWAKAWGMSWDVASVSVAALDVLGFDISRLPLSRKERKLLAFAKEIGELGDIRDFKGTLMRLISSPYPIDHAALVLLVSLVQGAYNTDRAYILKKYLKRLLKHKPFIGGELLNSLGLKDKRLYSEILLKVRHEQLLGRIRTRTQALKRVKRWLRSVEAR